MERRDARAPVLGLAAAALFTACGGPTTGRPAPDSGTPDVVSGGPGTDDGGLSDEPGIGGEAGAESGVSGSDGAMSPRTIASKIDLLFMIDNSASMGDKQNVLAQSVPELISRLVSPNCVDAAGASIARSQNGQCAQGHVEFTPVHDMHIGIVTSSLGGRGSDQCVADTKNPTNMALLGHDDDRGELLNRSGPSEVALGDAAPDNFLAWFPSVSDNVGQPAPSVPALSSVATLVGDFATAIEGVHEHGCGFEAQNEAWYRFLVQPDPFDHIQVNAQTLASLVGIDSVILRQRADFLRPDSLVAVIVVTDENEEVADPLAIGGQGWVFANSQFPGSPDYAAPEGTIECQQQDPKNLATTGPNDPKCTSCAFVTKTDPTFATRCPKDGTSGTGGFLDPQDDQLNVRFYNQKKRFGVSVGYPLSRYLRGLTRPSVPDSAHEHDRRATTSAIRTRAPTASTRSTPPPCRRARPPTSAPCSVARARRRLSTTRPSQGFPTSYCRSIRITRTVRRRQP